MESPPPFPCCISQSSKKRVFPGSSSSSCMEADVVETPPPANPSSNVKSLKQKEVIFPEIIDVDLDEDSADIMLVDREVGTAGKSKENFGKYPLGPSSGTYHRPGNGPLHASEKNNASGSHYLINGDGFDADLFYGENEYMDMFHDDHLYDDQYAILQTHLDSLDIPPGVEFSVPWFTAPQGNKMKLSVASTSTPVDLNAVPPHSDSSSSTCPWEFQQSNDKSASGGSGLEAKLKTVSYPTKWETSSSWLLEDPAQVGKRSTDSRSPTKFPSEPRKDSLNVSTKTELLKARSHSAESWRGKARRNPWFSDHFSSPPKPLDKGVSTDVVSNLQTKMHDIIKPGAVSHKFMWQDFATNATVYPSAPYTSGFVDPFWHAPFLPDDMAFNPWDKDPLKGKKSATALENSSGSFCDKGKKYGDPDEFLKNFDIFKRFDTVEDSSDHHYYGYGYGSSLKQPSKNWAKKIQEEWRILENDLPDAIYVRVYESRMDLLRAAIIGAEGTPYHDGLFFFDVLFPANYPNVPPLVYYHSGGLRINPNLYECGKVCLSLLNTWSGSQKEMWIPGVSTILQVLVSIQGLILNAKPFFNEPGYAKMSGTPGGEKNSLQYNENTFILSLTTMVYSIRRPPKYFEDLVAGHFFKRAHDILLACKACINGAQVGCLVKGGVQDVDEGDKRCSQYFRNKLAGCIKTIVDAFAEIGVKDCDEFLSLAQKTNELVSAAPMITNHY
ncbi:hypothetical protein ACH5RR_028071 [Cinchona calisaya]|uniref:E2 ubiquitin-conjugating enzyme n=1 Tax=Cinchona calisaya TaxID=153742 RepID=A0ABD2YMP3_9GENT